MAARVVHRQARVACLGGVPVQRERLLSWWHFGRFVVEHGMGSGGFAYIVFLITDDSDRCADSDVLGAVWYQDLG